jgi:hypothetical protein
LKKAALPTNNQTGRLKKSKKPANTGFEGFQKLLNSRGGCAKPWGGAEAKGSRD